MSSIFPGTREQKNKLLSILRFIPDEQYLKVMYRIRMGKKLNLDNPQTFNEKIQWLKLHDRRSEYVTMVDKYEVKKYVADIIGEKYIIPTLGIWDKFDDIDFALLPDQFVLKCTHDSGGLVICRDKATFSLKEARKKINASLSTNFYWVGREWPYKDVKPRIIAETYMEDKDDHELRDYKVFCFKGEPRFIQVDFDRFSDHKRNIYDLNWNYIDMSIKYPNDPKRIIKKPLNLNIMIDIARKLSQNIPEVRIDLYSVNGRVFFGETTFFHGGGFEKFQPEHKETEFGSLIDLRSI